jgi:quercetin dioxygenase-like cupin family protein
MNVINIKDAKELKTPHGKSVKWLLTKEIGTPNFEMRYFEVKKESEPSEGEHPWEHEVFVIKGEGIVKSGGVERKVKSGDAIFIPPNEPHIFSNVKKEPFGFICIIPKGCEDNIKRANSDQQR